VSGSELTALILALALSTSLLLSVVAVVWWFDRYDREPLHLIIGIFLWGAMAAPVLSVAACSTAGAVFSPDSLILVVGLGPLLEEVMKAAGIVLVVVLSREFDNPTDGLVYGTASGLGFAATENLVYSVVGTGEAVVHGTLLMVVIRTASTAGIHALSSAFFGGCLGFGHLSRGRVERLSWALGGLTGAVALHSGWNLLLLRLEVIGEVPQLTPWFVALPALYVLYIATLSLFLRSEQRILSQELAEEVALGVVPPWVCHVIPFYRRRIRSGWCQSRRERTVLARLLTRLAFRKHAVGRLPKDEADLAGLEIVRLRQRIRDMIGAEQDCQNSVEREAPGFCGADPGTRIDV
jgi:RsiW-degrading membrane proteinase PrsW (M82 family)